MPFVVLSMAKCHLVIIVNVYMVVSFVFVYITAENVSCPQNCVCSKVVIKTAPFLNKLKLKCGSNFTIYNLSELQLSTFWNSNDVVNLDLSGNNITYLGRKSFPFRELQKLDLSTNNIETIEDGAFLNLGFLKRLDLSVNRIKILASGMFEGLYNVEKLKLSQNSIRQIKEGTFDALVSLKLIDISDNRLLCDCELWWFGVWTVNMSIKLSPMAKCFDPLTMRGQPLRKLKTIASHCSWQEHSHFSPLQLSPDQDQVVFEGDSLRLDCSANSALKKFGATFSLAEISISWYWAGLSPMSIFPNSVRLENQTPLESGLLQSTLIIDELHSNHTGEWNCELMSSELNHTSTVSVIVISSRTNYCPTIVTKSNKGNYFWPKTVAGHLVDLPCTVPMNQATARYNCTINGTWSDLDVSACPYISETTRILQQYAKMNVSHTGRNSIIESLKRLQNYTLEHKLSLTDAMDIVFISQTISNYLEFVSMEKEVGGILLDLVSHLMDLDQHLLASAQLLDKSCSKLVRAVEIIGENGEMLHLYREGNVAVETFRVGRDNFLGFTCTLWNGKDGRRDKLFHCSSNKSTVPLTHEKIVQASVHIPESLFHQLEIKGRPHSTLQIFFAVFNNGKLFPSMNKSVSSPVVGAKIVGMEVRDLIRPAYVTLAGVGDGARPAWWDESKFNWDSKPCKPSQFVRDLLITECSHLGYFTLAPLIRRNTIVIEQAKSRFSSPLLYVGTFVSSTCLLVSTFTYAIWRAAIQMADKMKHALANSWLSFSLLSIAFSVGIYQTEDVRVCQCVGLLLHYLTLTSLFWMAITINVMRRCGTSNKGGEVVTAAAAAASTSVGSSECSESATGNGVSSPQPLTGLYLVGWGVAVLLVGLSGAVNPPGYVTPTYCSISPTPAFTPVLLPATTIQLFIITTAVLVVRSAAVEKDSNVQLSEGTQATDLELLEGTGSAMAATNAAPNADRASIGSVLTPSSRIDDPEHSIQVQLKAFLIIFCLFVFTWSIAALSVVKPFGIVHEETIFSSLYALCAIILGAFILFFYCFSRNDVRSVWFTLKHIKRCRNVSDVSPIGPIMNSNEERTVNSGRKSTSPARHPEIVLNKTNFVDLHRRQYQNNVLSEPNSFYNPHQSIVARKFFKKQRRKRNNLGSGRRAAGDGSASATSPVTSELFHLGSKVSNINIHVETGLHPIACDNRNILIREDNNVEPRNRRGPSLNERLVIGAESNADIEHPSQPILNNDGSLRYASVASDCCSCVVSEAHSAATDCTLRDLTSDQSSRSSHLYAIVAPDVSPPFGRLKMPLQLPDEDKRETSV